MQDCPSTQTPNPVGAAPETSILTHIPESAASFSGSGDLIAKVVPASSRLLKNPGERLILDTSCRH